MLIDVFIRLHLFYVTCDYTILINNVLNVPNWNLRTSLYKLGNDIENIIIYPWIQASKETDLLKFLDLLDSTRCKIPAL